MSCSDNCVDGELCYAIENNPQPELKCAMVAEVLKHWNNREVEDYPSYCWLLRLKDGRFAVAHGGHDYTGWDCQSSLESSIWPTLEDAVRLGLDVEQRGNLGVALPEDKIE